MEKRIFLFVISSFLAILMNGCGTALFRRAPLHNPSLDKTQAPQQSYTQLRKMMVHKYNHAIPKQWGEKVSGVKTMLATGEKVIALTFDACGGNPKSNGYDAKLIDFLKREQIPATLFISGKWQAAHPDLTKSLAREPLFEIGNHGWKHKPCSVNGRSAYHIQGTAGLAEVVDEIEKQGRGLAAVTGKKPQFYRSGTDYYDEVAVAVARQLGYQVVSYSVLGDAGATFNQEQVTMALLAAKPGSIVIMHMNHPESETAAGVMAAVPLLKKLGMRFVRLTAYPLR